MIESSGPRNIAASTAIATPPAATGLGTSANAAPHGDSFSQILEDHLECAPGSMETLRSTYPSWRWADIDAALESIDSDQHRLSDQRLQSNTRLQGVVPGNLGGISDLIVNREGAFRRGPVQRVPFPVGPSDARHVATNALRLLTWDQVPVVVFAHADQSNGERDVWVEVLAEDPSVARALLAKMDESVVRDSSLRGRIVSFTQPSEGNRSAVNLEFHARPDLDSDDVVLPHSRLERIESAVLGISRNAAHLRAVGQHLSRSVLLYGPPGTGKTHTVRYLLSQSPDTTAIIVQGGSLNLIRQAVAAARQLTPAIVVLEAADRLAADCNVTEGEHPVFCDLLDMLDDLDEDADIAFVFTTNRVAMLEDTLALRPGRVDLALELPRPPVGLRERLFARSARSLPVTAAGIRSAAEAAAGTTGSFPKEAVRRAVLDALSDGAKVDNARLVAAVRALAAEGEQLRAAMQRGHDDSHDDDFGLEGADDESGVAPWADVPSNGGPTNGGPTNGGPTNGGPRNGGPRNGDLGLRGGGLGDKNSGPIDLDESVEVDYMDDLDDGLSGDDLLDLDLDDED